MPTSLQDANFPFDDTSEVNPLAVEPRSTNVVISVKSIFKQNIRMQKFEKTDKPLFDNLRKLINLIDSFRDVGLHQHIELPRIAVLGTQSSGKSSLLENIVGLDFLPRGSGVVTRRPLELRMVHVNNPTSKPYGVFEQLSKQKKYTNFDEIRQMIESQTDKVAGTNKGIVDKPLKLTVYSYECPDLTLIDLPGITKISVGNQINDIQEVTTKMAERYCKQDRTIILAVIPANADMTTSQGLHLGRQWDPEGTRTLGVITKIDIMDRGTDASGMILNREVPLKLGYVGVKNRSQEDINNKVKVAIALAKEDEYFKSHSVYRNMDLKNFGTRALTKRLTEVLQKNINKHLRSILNEVNDKAKQCEEVIKSLGQPLPQDGKEKIHLIWKLLTQFTERYIGEIKGKSGSEVNQKLQKEVRLSTGSIIKAMFEELYQQQASKDFKVLQKFKDQEIERAIKNHQGDSIPGFPSIHAFLYLLTPSLEKLKQPAIELLNNVYTELRKISGELIAEVAKKAPSVMDEMINQADLFLQNLRSRAQQILTANIDSEISYIFTNDEHYLSERTKLIPTQTKKQPAKRNDGAPLMDAQGGSDARPITASKDTKEEREKLKKEAQKMFVKELRLRVDQYYRIVIRTLRQIVPKNIGFFLVRESQQKMQYSLYNELLKDEELIESLSEPPEVTAQRETAKKTLEVLNKARRIIRREVSGEQQQLQLQKSKIK